MNVYHRQICKTYMCTMLRRDIRIFSYSRTPLIRFNRDDEPSRYAENPDKWFFPRLKTGYIGSLKLRRLRQTAVLGYIFIYVQIKYKLYAQQAKQVHQYKHTIFFPPEDEHIDARNMSRNIV